MKFGRIFNLLTATTPLLLSFQTKCLASAQLRQHESLIQQQFSVDPFVDANKQSLVLDRTLQLAGCDFQADSFSSRGDLQCYYCHLSQDIWDAQREDPSILPSFRDMLGRSDHCSDHAYLFSLKDIAEKARKYDFENNTAVGKVKGVIVTQPSAGSSVLMNAIIVGEGSESHTFADHPAIIDLMDACESPGDNECMLDKQVSAMIDLIYMLSRTEKHDTKIYIKLNPSSSANINVLRKALSGEDVKWAYVQRDADEILLKATEKKRNGCLRNRNNPSDALLKYVQELGYTDLKELTDEEVCSAFFAHNHQAVVNEFSPEDPNTIFMDYEISIRNKDQLVTHLQDFFDINVNTVVYDKVHMQLQKETHSRGSRKLGQWVDVPRREIPESVKSANAKFLKKVVSMSGH